MPATPLLKVTINDQVKDGIILYKGHRYDIPYSNLISVSDVRNQQFDTSIDAQEYNRIIDNIFLVKADLPAGLVSQSVGFSRTRWIGGGNNRLETRTVVGTDEIFTNVNFPNFGTYLCGEPTTNGTYDVVFRVIGLTANWDIVNLVDGENASLAGVIHLGDTFFTLKIIVQDFPASPPNTTTITGTTPTTPIDQATTGSSTSEVELHAIPITTSTLTSSARSITVPFTATRIATTSAPTQSFMVKFGGVNVMDAAFVTTSIAATSCVISAKISKTSSSMFRFDISINSSIDGVQQQSITRTKSVSISSFSNSNLSLHATNAAGSSAPIISNYGNIINV
jgi:hypothetical protein